MSPLQEGLDAISRGDLPSKMWHSPGQRDRGVRLRAQRLDCKTDDGVRRLKCVPRITDAKAPVLMIDESVRVVHENIRVSKGRPFCMHSAPFSLSGDPGATHLLRPRRGRPPLRLLTQACPRSIYGDSSVAPECSDYLLRLPTYREIWKPKLGLANGAHPAEWPTAPTTALAQADGPDLRWSRRPAESDADCSA